MKLSKLLFLFLCATIASATDAVPYGLIRFNGVLSDDILNKDSENLWHFDFGAQQSVIGIKASDTAFQNKLVLNGKLEINFIDDYNFKLSHVFADFLFPNLGLNILFGKTQSLFSPFDPPTIDNNKLVGFGNLTKELYQIRITQKISTIEIAVAARNDKDYPAFESKISTVGHIKLGTSAFWASEKTAIDVDNNEDVPDSWGLSADLFAPIYFFNISGEFFMGQNLSNYGGISESYFKNIKFGVKSMGGWWALGFALYDFSLSTGIGLEKITSLYWPDSLWLSTAKFANLNYKITAKSKISLEYCKLSMEYMANSNRRVKNKEKVEYNRIGTLVTYEF